jgi:hypothetical protein
VSALPICERLRKTRAGLEVAPSGRDGFRYVENDQHIQINPDGPEAADTIEALVEALERAADAMTCRRDDNAHYCPNCDNSLYEARDNIRKALTRARNGGQP